MVFDHTLLFVILGAGLGAFVQGLCGFAFALSAMTIWAWTLEPLLIGPLAVFGSLIGQMLAFRSFRHLLRWRLVAPFVLGGLLGVPLGVLALRHIDPLEFRCCIGTLLVIWCPSMLFARTLPHLKRGGFAAELVIGLIGGIMGGLGGITGPAPTLWATLRHWERDHTRAVLLGFNLTMHAATIVTYIATGTVPLRSLPLFLPLAVAVVIPSFIGLRVYRRIDDAMFRRLILGLLTANGVILLATSLPKLL